MNLLSYPGLHYLATRFGWQSLRGAAFDARYHDGSWHHAHADPEMETLLRGHHDGGSVLAMGCGTATIQTVEQSGATSVTGVDLSSAAICLAQTRAKESTILTVGDMEGYQPEDGETYDVILFAESLYYVPVARIEGLLRRLSTYLAPDGVFIVTIAHPDRYSAIFTLLHDGFIVHEDRNLGKGQRRVLLFSADSP